MQVCLIILWFLVRSTAWLSSLEVVFLFCVRNSLLRELLSQEESLCFALFCLPRVFSAMRECLNEKGTRDEMRQEKENVVSFQTRRVGVASLYSRLEMFLLVFRQNVLQKRIDKREENLSWVSCCSSCLCFRHEKIWWHFFVHVGFCRQMMIIVRDWDRDREKRGTKRMRQENTRKLCGTKRTS